MASDLRERVARRLREDYSTVGDDALHLADYCIRLMEWARRNCSGQVPDMEFREKWKRDNPTAAKSGVVSTAMKYETLDLPPDEWQP